MYNCSLSDLPESLHQLFTLMEENGEQAALRELKEESGLISNNHNYAGKIMFRFSQKPEWDQLVHLYLVKEFSGEPAESDEMLPQWFNHEEIPYSQMWSDDKHWLPLILKDKKIDAEFTFGEDNETIAHHQINLL